MNHQDIVLLLLDLSLTYGILASHVASWSAYSANPRPQEPDPSLGARRQREIKYQPLQPQDNGQYGMPLRGVRGWSSAHSGLTLVETIEQKLYRKRTNAMKELLATEET